METTAWIVPILAAICERIRQSTHRMMPYNFDLNPDGNGLDKNVMAIEAARTMTFDRWPHMHYR